MRLTLSAALLAAAALTIAPQAADAGTYDVLSCARTSQGVNHAWLPSNDSPVTLRLNQLCPPNDELDGLAAFDELGSANTAADRVAKWTVRSPTGTSISRLRAWRYLGKADDQRWRPAAWAADGTVIETCEIQIDAFSCEVGSRRYDAATSFDSSLHTTEVSYGVRCEGSDFCPNGERFHNAFVALYGAEVTITDPSPPTFGNVWGELAVPGWHRGDRQIAFAASDNTGVQNTRLRVGGAVRSTVPRSCDYTYTVPCSNEPAAAHNLDTRTLRDGTHSLQLSATDAAGNEQTTTRTIAVDNTAPAAPEALTATRRGAEVALAWRNPGGQFAPIARAHFELCEVGGSCRGGAVSGPSLDRLDGLRVSGPGPHTASVWLEDEAGNSDRTRAGGPIAIAPAGARAAARLRLSSVRRTAGGVTVSGRIAPGARGSVRLVYKASRGGRTLVARAATRARAGRFRARLRLSPALRSAGRGTLEVRYGGDSTHRRAVLRRRITP